MAADQLKVSGAVGLAERMRDRSYLEALSNAEAKAVYGDAFAPKNDDVIAIDSPTTTNVTHNHFPSAAQPSTPKAGLPTWAKVVGAALLAGAGGAAATYALKSNASNSAAKPAATSPPAATQPAEPTKSKSYNIDFW